NLHRLRHSPAFGPFTCWHCGGPGDADTEPATLIAELGPRDAYAAATTVLDVRAVRAALAHAECSPSQVVSTIAAPPALTQLDAGRWRTLLADLPRPDGFLPLLMLDLHPELAARTGPDEYATRCISALLNMGL